MIPVLPQPTGICDDRRARRCLRSARGPRGGPRAAARAAALFASMLAWRSSKMRATGSAGPSVGPPVLEPERLKIGAAVVAVVAAGSADRSHLAVLIPPAQRLRRDADVLGRLADPQEVGFFINHRQHYTALSTFSTVLHIRARRNHNRAYPPSRRSLAGLTPAGPRQRKAHHDEVFLEPDDHASDRAPLCRPGTVNASGAELVGPGEFPSSYFDAPRGETLGKTGSNMTPTDPQ